MKRKKTSSPERIAMQFLCTFLGILLAVMLSVTVLFQYLLKQINYEGPSVSTFSAQFDAPDTKTGPMEFLQQLVHPQGNPRHIVNILLIGQDKWENESRARSDSMILCTFNSKTHQLTMTSILRDLYVPIPGHGSNRVNAAYAYGGMPLLNQTLENNLDVSIDGTVEVDFTQFSRVVDALGGVQIELRQDEADTINKKLGCKLKDGMQTLTGEQALAYSRIRALDSDGDFSRTNRHRKVITALIGSLKDSNPKELLSTAGTVLSMITTDMKNADILKMAIEWMPLLSEVEIVSQRIPADGTYNNRSIDGMSVLVADMDAARQLMRDTVGE